jgi:hypothetical protein
MMIQKQFCLKRITLEQKKTTGTFRLITINVPLFLEVRDFMFFSREKHIISHFAGFFFEGPRLF